MNKCTDTLTAFPVEGKEYSVVKYEEWTRKPEEIGNGLLIDSKKVTYHNPNYGLSEEEILKRTNISKLSGYYPKKEFYQPNYDKEPNDNSLPDARNTLLWEPLVKTDEKGEADLSFFCSDINSRFMVQIEGTTKDGLSGNRIIEFLVTKKKE